MTMPWLAEDAPLLLRSPVREIAHSFWICPEPLTVNVPVTWVTPVFTKRPLRVELWSTVRVPEFVRVTPVLRFIDEATCIVPAFVIVPVAGENEFEIVRSPPVATVIV